MRKPPTRVSATFAMAEPVTRGQLYGGLLAEQSQAGGEEP